MFSVLLLATALSAPPPPPVEPPATRARGSLVALFRDSDYPKEAMKRAEEGTVRVRLTDRAGLVSDCAVTQSSGSAALDSATCRILRERARFTPARDSRGRAVADIYSQSVRWQLPNGGGMDDGVHRYIFAFDDDGRLGPCSENEPGAGPGCESLRQ